MTKPKLPIANLKKLLSFKEEFCFKPPKHSSFKFCVEAEVLTQKENFLNEVENQERVFNTLIRQCVGKLKDNSIFLKKIKIIYKEKSNKDRLDELCKASRRTFRILLKKTIIERFDSLKLKDYQIKSLQLSMVKIVG